MENKFEKLNLFFERIKTIGFWQRVFGWKLLKSLSYDAYEEFKSLQTSLSITSEELDKAKESLSLLKNDNAHLENNHTTIEYEFKALKEKHETQGAEVQKLKSENAKNNETIRKNEEALQLQKVEVLQLKENINTLTVEKSDLAKKVAIFEQTESDRKKKYAEEASTLTAITTQLQDDRKKEVEEKQRMEIERLKMMKETWAKHQDSVKNVIKSICQKRTIEYVDKVPFKGNPDNTIKICDEFIIFDAKSPASDSLENFPSYIKSQTEIVKKYIKEDNVKKDIFLVVPSNTVEVLERFSYNMADYTVYVVTIDVLEPIMLSLKKIEDYEFVDQLTPEERENICRLIGKFAHITKRRIQIDQFFEWQFLEILTKCKTDLPQDILEKVIEFEKSEKLNPPQEKRIKQILTKELQADSEKIQNEAKAKGIVFPPSMQQEIKKLPLYEDDKPEG